MSFQFHIDPDIRKAETLPASFYKDPEIFEALKQQVFLTTWQWIGDTDQVALPETVYPFVLMEGFLTEPMLLTRDSDDEIHCMTNVCTHRGNLVALHHGTAKRLICMYHGRRFDLEGNYEQMPEFEAAEDFPRPCDNLHRFPLEQWGPFLFAGLNPSFPFQEVLDIMNERVGFLPLNEFTLDRTHGKEYLVHAHWALYCDNYLEGASTFLLYMKAWARPWIMAVTPPKFTTTAIFK